MLTLRVAEREDTEASIEKFYSLKMPEVFCCCSKEAQERVSELADSLA